MARTKKPANIKKQILTTSAQSLAVPGAPANDRFIPLEELGVAGAKISSGFVHDEYIAQLQGERGRRTYRQMRDNDSVIGAVLFAVEMLIRSVDWKVETDNPDVPGSDDGVEFLETIPNDMEHTWDDFISDVVSMLWFGWQWTEEIYKLRIGPDENNPERRSNNNDGRYGIRKLANRAQETLWQWNILENGDILGMWQQPPVAGNIRYIPWGKSMLFRPHQHKGSPEGRSVIRNAYRPWFFLKNIQEVEAIGIERELNGLPVVKVPGSIIKANGPELGQYERMVRDVKFNDQSGIVIPSNPWTDQDGTPSNLPMVDFQLLSASGSRAIDTTEVIHRYQQDIARTILADFIMLGSNNRASFGALADNKSDFFTLAVTGWLDSIAETINRTMVPRLWRLNGMDPQAMAKFVPGRVRPINIQELGNFIDSLARAGAPLFPDNDLENYLREAASLPRREENMEGVEDTDLQAMMQRFQDRINGTRPQEVNASAQNRPAVEEGDGVEE